MRTKEWEEGLKLAAAKLGRGTLCALQDLFTAMPLEGDAVEYWDKLSYRDLWLDEIDLMHENGALILTARLIKGDAPADASTRTVLIEQPKGSDSLIHIVYQNQDLLGGSVFEVDVLKPPDRVLRRLHDLK